MRGIVAAALPCAVIPFIVEAELTVSSWDFTKDTANTVPWAAADWDDADNWSAGVPDGSGWRAELTGAEETVDFSGLDGVRVSGATEDLCPGEYRILTGASGLAEASGLKVSVDGVLRRDFRCVP
jgi:hypothetical protein